MASAIILHVGDDVCQRIPVLTWAGFDVLCSQNSTSAIRAVLAEKSAFSAILFNCDQAPPAELTLDEVRGLSAAPCVLFENPAVVCKDSDFDLVVPALTPPGVWLEKLTDLIHKSRRLCEQAQKLRMDSESVRSQSRLLRASAAQPQSLD